MQRSRAGLDPLANNDNHIGSSYPPFASPSPSPTGIGINSPQSQGILSHRTPRDIIPCGLERCVTPTSHFASPQPGERATGGEQSNMQRSPRSPNQACHTPSPSPQVDSNSSTDTYGTQDTQGNHSARAGGGMNIPIPTIMPEIYPSQYSSQGDCKDGNTGDTMDDAHKTYLKSLSSPRIITRPSPPPPQPIPGIRPILHHNIQQPRTPGNQPARVYQNPVYQPTYSQPSQTASDVMVRRPTNNMQTQQRHYQSDDAYPDPYYNKQFQNQLPQDGRPQQPYHMPPQYPPGPRPQMPYPQQNPPAPNQWMPPPGAPHPRMSQYPSPSPMHPYQQPYQQMPMDQRYNYQQPPMEPPMYYNQPSYNQPSYNRPSPENSQSPVPQHQICNPRCDSRCENRPDSRCSNRPDSRCDNRGDARCSSRCDSGLGGCDSVQGCRPNQDCGTTSGCGSSPECGKSQGCGASSGCGSSPVCGGSQGCRASQACSNIQGCGSSPSCASNPSCISSPSCLSNPSCVSSPNCGINQGCGSSPDCAARQAYSASPGGQSYTSSSESTKNTDQNKEEKTEKEISNNPETPKSSSEGQHFSSYETSSQGNQSVGNYDAMAQPLNYYNSPQVNCYPPYNQPINSYPGMPPANQPPNYYNPMLPMSPINCYDPFMPLNQPPMGFYDMMMPMNQMPMNCYPTNLPVSPKTETEQRQMAGEETICDDSNSYVSSMHSPTSGPPESSEDCKTINYSKFLLKDLTQRLSRPNSPLRIPSPIASESANTLCESPTKSPSRYSLIDSPTKANLHLPLNCSDESPIRSPLHLPLSGSSESPIKSPLHPPTSCSSESPIRSPLLMQACCQYESPIKSPLPIQAYGLGDSPMNSPVLLQPSCQYDSSLTSASPRGIPISTRDSSINSPHPVQASYQYESPTKSTVPIECDSSMNSPQKKSSLKSPYATEPSNSTSPHLMAPKCMSPTVTQRQMSPKYSSPLKTPSLLRTPRLRDSNFQSLTPRYYDGYESSEIPVPQKLDPGATSLGLNDIMDDLRKRIDKIRECCVDNIKGLTYKKTDMSRYSPRNYPLRAGKEKLPGTPPSRTASILNASKLYNPAGETPSEFKTLMGPPEERQLTKEQLQRLLAMKARQGLNDKANQILKLKKSTSDSSSSSTTTVDLDHDRKIESQQAMINRSVSQAELPSSLISEGQSDAQGSNRPQQPEE